MALLKLDGRLLVTEIFKSLVMTSWDRSGGHTEIATTTKKKDLFTSNK